ncbi:phosphoribosylformylglycinamidine synthase PurS subunit [Synechococcus sp. Ace-Pa]|nr:phosphoribosylformylglycinamidine synthase PurS subunit [Synechococcus sp. Ace-Pa]
MAKPRGLRTRSRAEATVEGHPVVSSITAIPASHSFNLDQRQELQERAMARFNQSPELPVPRFQARVLVSLRPSVLDPAGEATRAAAARLGVEGVVGLRIGKAVEIEIEAIDASSARSQLELLSERLLANPVIEDWSLELQSAEAGAAA